MPIDGIFGGTVEILGKTLDLRVKRQELISANLANVETPGYRPTDLSFEKELSSALKKGGRTPAVTNPRHIPLKHQAVNLASVTGTVLQTGTEVGPDGNGVEMETEMGRMAENQIMYNASVQLLTKKLEALKLAIKGN